MIDAVRQSLFFPGNKEGVLCLHGFTGAPLHLEYLASSLSKEGYTVSVPLLPGHGHSGEVFVRSHWKQWLAAADTAYQDLEKRCTSISVVGLSLGGLLATLVSSFHSPQKLVLCAPAFRIMNPYIHIAPLVGLICKRIRKPHFSDSDNGELLSREYDSYYWPRHTGYVLKLARKAKSVVHTLSSPILLILSHNDDVVPVSVEKILRSRLQNIQLHTLYLDHSGHVVTNGTQRSEVAHKIIDFLR